MEEKNVVFEKKGKIGLITLDRPQKLNAFSEGMRLQILDALNEVAADKSIRVCIITGTGRAFCAGGDISIMNQLKQKNDGEILNSFLAQGKEVVNKIRNMPIPILAMVNGPAAGAGMNLALSCDIRIASTNASFGQTFIKIGLNPDWGGTYFLPQIVGSAKALELIWTGEMISADEALRLNLVNRVVPHENLVEETFKFANVLATKSPLAIQFAKKAIYQWSDEELEKTINYENEVQIRCFKSQECTEGLANFLNSKNKAKSNQLK
jgi:enoyl-CoA hydratase/carnithine racemase